MLKRLILTCVLVGSFNLVACQAFIPKAQGLPSFKVESHQQITQTSEPYQIELFWKEHTFSFLLEQQQQDHLRHVIALTLTGQVLFELQYDGQTVKVLQRYPALKALPLDFLMRDIWWATLTSAQIEPALKSLNLTLSEQQSRRQIMQNHHVKLDVQYSAQEITVKNLSVPYRMILTPISQPLLNENTLP